MKCAAAKAVPKLLIFKQIWHPHIPQKGYNRWQIFATKAHHPYENVQKSQDRKKHVKFSRMQRFCPLLFFDYNGVVYHKVFYKQNYGFYIIITPQLTQWCLCSSFWPKTKALSRLTPTLYIKINQNYSQIYVYMKVFK